MAATGLRCIPGEEETFSVLIVTGPDHTCARKTDGSLWCWGENSNGELGDGTTNDSLVPVEVTGNDTWKSISDSDVLYRQYSCGIKSDDTAWCWGENSGNGQLGDGTTNDSLIPVEVAGGGTWKVISPGYLQGCGIKSDGTAWCWGQNDGNLGDGTWNSSKTPVEVAGGATWKTITAGNQYTCGIKSDDTAWCWGYNNYGEIGDGSPTGTKRLSPVTVSGSATWKAISAGEDHSCGIKSDGTAWCWGQNYAGELGDGTSNDSLVPVPVSGGHTWKTISAGYYYTCGVKSDDTAWCWGGGWGGQTGLGSTSHTDVPTPVSGW